MDSLKEMLTQNGRPPDRLSDAERLALGKFGTNSLCCSLGESAKQLFIVDIVNLWFFHWFWLCSFYIFTIFFPFDILLRLVQLLHLFPDVRLCISHIAECCWLWSTLHYLHNQGNNSQHK